jgi:hypothetical protein
VIGPLDDVVVVALALRYAARQVPRDVLAAGWPGEPGGWSACSAAEPGDRLAHPERALPARSIMSRFPASIE